MKNLINTLLPLGFNEKQAQIYISAVSLGDCLISEVAKKSGINRITAYDIIEKLEAKKIVKTYTKKRMKYIQATPPQELLSNFHEYILNLEQHINEFPTPNKKQNENSVEIHEDKSALAKIFKQTLQNDADIQILFSHNCFAKIDADYNKYLQEITKNHQTTIINDQNTDLSKIELANNTVVILQDKTTILIQEHSPNPIITIVKNAGLSQTYQQIFNQLLQKTEVTKPHAPIKTALLTKLQEPQTETPIDNKEEKINNMTLF